jgi:iron complex outermembrane receptor protein
VDSVFSPFDMTRLNYGQDEEHFSQELRLASSGPYELEWLVGAYYFINDSANSQETLFRSGMAGNPNNPFGTGTGARRLNSEGENEGTALFGQGTAKLPANLSLTAGLCYKYETVGMDRTMTDTPDQGSSTRTDFPNASNDFSALLSKACIAWHASEHKMIYATVS